MVGLRTFLGDVVIAARCSIPPPSGRPGLLSEKHTGVEKNAKAEEALWAQQKEEMARIQEEDKAKLAQTQEVIAEAEERLAQRDPDEVAKLEHLSIEELRVMRDELAEQAKQKRLATQQYNQLMAEKGPALAKAAKLLRSCCEATGRYDKIREEEGDEQADKMIRAWREDMMKAKENEAGDEVVNE